MSEDPEKSGARSAVILTVVAVVVAVYCLQFGLQTLLVIESRSWASVNPWLMDVPTPLSPAPAVNAASPPPKGSQGPTKLRVGDYDFIAPWPGKVFITPLPMGTEIHFDSGQTIVFFAPETQVDALQVLQKSDPIQYREFQRTFADRPIGSNYELYKAVYEASPAQASAFMSGDDQRRLNALLLWKLSFGFDAQPGIHSFEAGGNRGFQFGDPASGHPVAVRVFDGQNQQFRLMLLTTPGSAGKVTQEDVNTVLASLRTLPILER